jgi:hypothetical protein
MFNMRFVVRNALFKIDGRTDTLQITVKVLRKIHYHIHTLGHGRSTRKRILNSKYFVGIAGERNLSPVRTKLLQH